MPVLNLERFIAESIESVLAQSYGDWELILVDDGSTDASAEIARSYCEAHPARIRLLQHPGGENRGASAARNLGIRAARGEYLALLDADDVWLPNKLAEQVPLLDSHPRVGSLYGNTLYWYSWAGPVQEVDRMPRLGFPSNTVLDPPTLLVRILRKEVPVPCTCSLLMRREVVEQVGGFEERFARVFTDQSFYAKLFLEASVLVMDECWDKYRRHPDSSCSIVEAAGELPALRLAYLDWFAGYLRQRGMARGELWKALRYALRQQRYPRLHGVFRSKLVRWAQRHARRSKRFYRGLLHSA